MSVVPTDLRKRKLERLPDPFEGATTQDLDEALGAYGKMPPEAPQAPPSELEVQDVLTRYLGDRVFADQFMRCMRLIRAKNADYTAGNAKSDRISAFRKIAADTGASMQQVLYIYVAKHWQAIIRFIRDGVVESESIHGRIDDVINYMVLLSAIVDELEKAPS